MTDTATFVIIGAGLAGAKAAETLREEGFDGRLVLVGAEDHPPYERPPLSKGLLLGTATADSTYVRDRNWYADHDIDLRTGATAEAIERGSGRVVIAGGDSVRYDRLLIATGAVPRPLTLPGVDLDGVLQLRTLSDSHRIAAALRPGAHLVIIGAGWIGLEVAAAARTHGAAVTVVEAATLPLQRVLGDRMARVFADLHTAHGVDFRFGNQVVEIRGTDRVSQVVLADGAVIGADAVLVAVGARPDVSLAADAGLAIDNGIVVDHRLRTNDPHIFAAGDVAAVDHPLLGARVRVEHWDNALHTGPAAARAMLDRDVVYDRLPYFFTDQYDLGMEHTGWVPPGRATDVIVRGDLDRREFVAFWTDRGRIVAGMNVNVWDVSDQIETLVRNSLTGALSVSPGKLADPAIALADLLS